MFVSSRSCSDTYDLIGGSDSLELAFEEPIQRGRINGLAPVRDVSFRIRPDLLVLVNNMVTSAVELEVKLSSMEQIRQIYRYLKALFKYLCAFTDEDLSKFGYFRFFRVICIALEISGRFKKVFNVLINDNCSPIFILSLKDNWNVLPVDSVTYKAFNLIYSEDLSLMDSSRKKRVFSETIDSFDRIWEKFYFISLVERYGDDVMKSLVKEKRAEGEIPALTDAVKDLELDHSWVRLLSEESLRYLTPEQLKYLTPEQIAKLPPEQLKYLTPEQLKYLTPEQIANLPPEKTKYLTPEQIAELDIDKLAEAYKKMDIQKRRQLSKIFRDL